MRLAAILLLLLGLASCKANKDVVDQCFGLRLDQQEFVDAKVDLVKIKSVEIKDGCIMLRFTIDKACDLEKISMHWDYRVKKSKPGQVKLKLAYSGKADCQSNTEYGRRYELKELMNPAYKGKLLLKVNDWPETLELNY